MIENVNAKLLKVLTCVHIFLAVIGYVYFMLNLKCLVSPKGLGIKYVLLCCIFVNLYVFDM